MKTKDITQAEGVVNESLPNTMFRVQLNDDSPDDLAGSTILCTLSGKMRMYKIKVMPGDKVKCEVSRYDPTRGRIVFRTK
ncbi:translation initiation factor IF-1 [Pseudomonadota bacterium]